MARLKTALDCTSPTDGRGKISLPVSTTDELWATIEAAEEQSGVARSIPEGWITRYDYALKEHCGLEAARLRLDRLVKDGVLQTALAHKGTGGRAFRCYGLAVKSPGNLNTPCAKSKEPKR